LICLLFTLASVGEVAAQTGSITGRVTDNNGAPLSGVQVAVQGTQLGGLTSEQGRYLIQRVPAGSAVVRVIRLGYGTISKTVTVPADGSVAADFELTIEAIALEGLVAVGYGVQKKINLTGAVAAAPIEQVSKLPVPTLNVALQGVAPGLQVIDGGQFPGRESVTMLIRGFGTLGGQSRNNPLILVDGVEGSISTVDVDDVESVSVLKDASSAAIYGSRAANGVILITTKRGQARDKVQITYSGYVGMQDITMFPERVSVADHMRLTNISYTNAGRAPKYSAGYIDSTLNKLDPLRYPSTNWLDEMYDPAPIQDHTLRISGGSESARYALSLNYMKEDGMMANTAADRYAARLNTDFRASERLTAGFDLSASRRWNISGYEAQNSTFYFVHDTPPTVVSKFPDGTYGWSDTNRNPIALAEATGDIINRDYQGVATGRANYDIVPGWLQLQTVGSVRYDHGDDFQFRRAESFYDHWDPTRLRRTVGPTRLSQTMDTGLQTTLRSILDFGHTFLEQHDVSGLFGYEQIEDEGHDLSGRRDNFYNNELRVLSMGSEDTDTNGGGGSEWALQSLFGRLNYSFKGRYLFEANARYDGSSRFAADNRWGFFPSFSAAWRISEEPFFKMGWLNELKLRGSWGQLGNQTVGLYSYYSTVSLNQPFYFGGATSTGAAKSSLQNPNISWETTTATDFGFDAALLNNRLTVTGDVYHRRTDDILLTLPIPLIVGQGAPTQNAGVVENKGWELSLGWKDQAGQLRYGVDFNLSDNKNKVLDLHDTGPYVSGNQVTKVGYPINSYYGYHALGLFQNQAEIDAHAKQNTEFTHPGDIKFEDQPTVCDENGENCHGDGQIDAADRVIMGDPNPRYQFGVNLTLGWKNFDAAAFFQGVGKRNAYVSLGLAEGPVWENYTHEWHLDYWTPENPDARLPVYYLYQNYNQNRISSWWILDAKYIKLRNVQLGYTMPSSLAGKLGVERLRLYVSGKNLWTKHGMGIDLDPEFSRDRGDYYPQTKVFSIGTDITF
jgi:TonB-linked SusC/RagA family outer membrane protein